MSLLQAPIAAVNPAVYGLAGSLIGALAAGTASFVVARQARAAAEQAWVRDNRREIYDRFLTSAQRLLVALVEAGGGDGVDDAYSGFHEAYVVVQTVAGAPLVKAARDYANRLAVLRSAGKASDRARFADAAGRVRDARHDTIDEMRKELGLTVIAWPDDDIA